MDTWVLTILKNDIVKHTWLVEAADWMAARDKFLKLNQDQIDMNDEPLIKDGEELSVVVLEFEQYGDTRFCQIH